MCHFIFGLTPKQDSTLFPTFPSVSLSLSLFPFTSSLDPDSPLLSFLNEGTQTLFAVWKLPDPWFRSPLVSSLILSFRFLSFPFLYFTFACSFLLLVCFCLIYLLIASSPCDAGFCLISQREEKQDCLSSPPCCGNAVLTTTCPSQQRLAMWFTTTSGSESTRS